MVSSADERVYPILLVAGRSKCKCTNRGFLLLSGPVPELNDCFSGKSIN